MIERFITQRIKESQGLGKALVILGPRQVGKTTLLEELTAHIIDKMVFSGDEPDIRELLSHVTSDRLRDLFSGRSVIIIDEAQRIPDIGITLKLIIDKIPEVQLLVSGSSSLELASSINEPLTGRKFEYQLYPLSFGEMVKHHGLITEKRLLPERLVYGYYPEVVTHPGMEIQLLKELASSYLYKDILAYGPVKKPVILDKLLRALAMQVGNEVSFMELSQMVGADKETVERYVDLLEKAFIVIRINALSRNVRNEIRKGKKIYFWDNGMRNAIIGNYMSWENRTDKGASWENFIVMERVKHLAYSGFYGNLYFWRTSQNQEIDLIEEQDGQFSAFEFTVGSHKIPKIPVTFSNAYPVRFFKVIHPDTVEEVLK
jgi:predicted AAA+ superfamily ATPase